MRRSIRWTAAAVLGLLLAPFALGAAPSEPLPWREAGLTERQAAAHMLERFAFGPWRGEAQIDAVLEQGLEAWLEKQLRAAHSDPDLDRRLAGHSTLTLSAEEIAETYPSRGQVLRQARGAGVISAEMDPETFQSLDETDRQALRWQVMGFAREQGYRPQRELHRDLLTRKIVSAVYSENQLREVLVDFWTNHFHVSVQHPRARIFVPVYERDAIRPHVLGEFRSLLEATAHHPAMLLYLDNARSVADEGRRTTLDARAPRARGRARRSSGDGPRQRPDGLNENYARELLELHTLGVEGGYTQDDVIEVARAFTGWTLLPPPVLDRLSRDPRRLERARRIGFERQGLFVFRPDVHDAEPKTVLGRRLPGGRGIEDGQAVLDLVAAHPATARHLATKLAQRFVADDPPASLVDRLTAVFQGTSGDLSAVLREIAYAPEFWAPEVIGAKVKSPFELAVSSLRLLGAEVRDVEELARRLEAMGQPLYAHPAPTGYPEESAGWASAGTLLERLRFAGELTQGQIAGVQIPLAEDETRETALRLGSPEFQRK